jgi:hypothetical protein
MLFKPFVSQADILKNVSSIWRFSGKIEKLSLYGIQTATVGNNHYSTGRKPSIYDYLTIEHS